MASMPPPPPARGRAPGSSPAAPPAPRHPSAGKPQFCRRGGPLAAREEAGPGCREGAPRAAMDRREPGKDNAAGAIGLGRGGGGAGAEAQGRDAWALQSLDTPILRREEARPKERFCEGATKCAELMNLMGSEARSRPASRRSIPLHPQTSPRLRDLGRRRPGGRGSHRCCRR